MNLQEKQAYVKENLHLVPEEELKLFRKNLARVFAKNSSCFETNQTISLEDVVAITKGYPVQGMDEFLQVACAQMMQVLILSFHRNHIHQNI